MWMVDISIIRKDGRTASRFIEIFILILALWFAVSWTSTVHPGAPLQRSAEPPETADPAILTSSAVITRTKGFRITSLIKSRLTCRCIGCRDKSFIEMAAAELDKAAAGTDRLYRNGVGWSIPTYSQSLEHRRYKGPVDGTAVLGTPTPAPRRRSSPSPAQSLW
jgi:hypothetical protein